jgi:prephenate dehydratase
MIVAIQGAPGSFSEGAARLLVGPDADLISCESFDELFAAVASGQADRGVVPVHNTIAGPVYDNAERAAASTFVTMGRLSYPVRQCLIAPGNIAVAELRRVASHPVALRQCTRFFATHPDCVAVEVPDTGGGVRDLMLGRLAADAVIGASTAASLYGATVLLAGIEDRADNVTEFALIARPGTSPANTQYPP